MKASYNKGMPLPEIFQHLLDPVAYPHPVDSVRLIETHISWLLIAGAYAYKIKKPVNLGFLDFSTIEKRHYYCEEEVRLNRRQAAATYLAVVPVTAMRIETAGPVLDWAVKMRAFAADATLDREAEITQDQIDAIADRVARFHGEIERAPAASGFGTAERVMFPMRENLRQITGILASGPPHLGSNETDMAASSAQLHRTGQWSEQAFQGLTDHFLARKQSGCIRECHGDLHLANIAWVDQAPLIFDCIEFNPDLRFIDVISEVAFLCMDLISRNQAPLAWRFLNRYLEHTGDYTGLIALRFYLVYRALVRAKVAGIRVAQGDLSARQELFRYLALADRLSQTSQPALLLMHGYSGSGKSWLSQHLLEHLGAIRLRSDVERKRLFNLPALADSKAMGTNIYTPAAGEQTFNQLQTLTSCLLDADFRVIVDATFLGRTWRAGFIDLARSRAVPWRIVSLAVDLPALRERIEARMCLANDASEADLAVLDSQITHAEPLNEKEQANCLHFAQTDRVEQLIADLATLCRPDF